MRVLYLLLVVVDGAGDERGHVQEFGQGATAPSRVLAYGYAFGYTTSEIG